MRVCTGDVPQQLAECSLAPDVAERLLAQVAELHGLRADSVEGEPRARVREKPAAPLHWAHCLQLPLARGDAAAESARRILEEHLLHGRWHQKDDALTVTQPCQTRVTWGPGLMSMRAEWGPGLVSVTEPRSIGSYVSLEPRMR